MNSILFDAPFNKENFIHSNKVFWHYSWLKRKKQLINWSILSVVFLGLGVFVSIQDGGTVNPYIFMGILSCCLMVLRSIEMFFSWKNYNNKIREIADEYEKTGSEQITEITEDHIKFIDYQVNITLRFSAFKYYTVFKEHIILIPKNYISGGLLIDSNNEGSDKYHQTLELLKDKLKYLES